MSANHLNGFLQARSDHYPDDVNAHTPLLTKSLPKSASLSRKISLLLQDWWLWEILSALVAILATTAIIVILVLFDGSSLPDWPNAITLNSVISFFAVITKISFTAAVGASISQSKWLWFRQGESRPLQHLQLFDDASRGPWGALALLINVKARQLTFVGATITVLLLFFDPFLQQVVIYPDRLVPSEKVATIVRAQKYQARSNEGLPLPSIVDMSMKAAVYQGIFDVKNQADVQVQQYCSTGNCTWQDFSSLAVCSQCANITSYVEKSCNSDGCYELSLPGGPTISGFGGQINTSVTNIASDLKDIQASVVQFSSLISRTKNDSDDTTAWECALFYCVNRYASSVTDGEFRQEISATSHNDSASGSQDSDLYYHAPDSKEPTFRVANLAAQAMNSFMSKTFSGSGSINSTASGPGFSSDVIHALYDTTNYSQRIENLAISMTNNIRQQNDSGSTPFSGLAYKTETYVKVRWEWFSYPATLVILSLLYLLGTIIETTYRDVSIWKSSNMAMLFHGQGMILDDPNYVPVTTLSEMNERHKDIQIELVQTEDEGWKLMQRRGE